MKVGEICNRRVVFARRHESVTQAAERMREHHVGNLIVVDEGGEGRVPIGILTDRDIVVGVVARSPERLEALTVGDVMTDELVTALADASVYDTLMDMRKHGVRRIPVVDREDELIGILAFDDVVEYLAEELGKLADIVRRERRREEERRP